MELPRSITINFSRRLNKIKPRRETLGDQKGDETIYQEYKKGGKVVEHIFEITYVTSFAQQGGVRCFWGKACK